MDPLAHTGLGRPNVSLQSLNAVSFNYDLLLPAAPPIAEQQGCTTAAVKSGVGSKRQRSTPTPPPASEVVGRKPAGTRTTKGPICTCAVSGLPEPTAQAKGTVSCFSCRKRHHAACSIGLVGKELKKFEGAGKKFVCSACYPPLLASSGSQTTGEAVSDGVCFGFKPTAAERAFKCCGRMTNSGDGPVCKCRACNEWYHAGCLGLRTSAASFRPRDDRKVVLSVALLLTSLRSNWLCPQCYTSKAAVSS